MDAFTPAQTTELVSRIGAKKARMRLDKMFFNSFMGGPLLGFGCALSLSTLSSPWFQTNAPGLIRTLGAMVFPVGLIMCILTGADLFTSYVLFTPVALLHRRCSFKDLAVTWFVSFFGNLAGMLFFVCVLVGYGGIFATGVYQQEAIAFAVAKAVTPQWHQIFLRGILANWLVTMAVFLSISSREVISKIVAIWFPVMCFVGLGTDHVIANMFFIPLGIFLGAPAPLTVSYYIWKSMIPAALGNIVGGGLFVGVMYWYLYIAGNDVEIHFDTGAVQTAVYRQSGPIDRRDSGAHHGEVVNVAGLPDSGGMAKSGLAKDLHIGQFRKDESDSSTHTSV